MTDPIDAELLRFVAEFVGWRDFTPHSDGGLCGFDVNGLWKLVPDYLGSVDAWGEVWEKVDLVTRAKWWTCIWGLFNPRTAVGYDIANATARQRCLALWRALDGRLPE